MIRKLLLLSFVGISLFSQGYAQQGDKTGPTQITIASKGDDVRGVLSGVFAQAGKDFVLEPNIRFVLYLSLTKMEFEEALQIICKTAELKYEVQNGVYFISKKHVPPPIQASPEPKPTKPIEPRGKLSQDVLKKTLTTRLSKTDLRDVFAEIEKQTGVRIEVAPDFPRYRVDAFLIGTSLKYALDVLTQATRAKYAFTDRLSILISGGKDENRVVVIEH